MKPSEENNFEAQWKRALGDASVPPPKSVWDGIEAKLEEEDHKLLPLAWWQTRKTLLVAASIAALLLVGGGVWYSGLNRDTFGVGVALQHDEPKSIQQPSSGKMEVAGQDQTIDLAQSDLDTKSSTTSEAAISAVKKGDATTGKQSPELAVARPEVSRGTSSYGAGTDYLGGAVSASKLAPNALMPVSSQVKTPVRDEIAGLPASAGQYFALELLDKRPTKESEVLMQKRYVFYKPGQDSEPVLLAGTGREYYAGLSFMPASFNPNLKVVSAPESFRTMSYASQSAVDGGSKSGASYAFQTQGGVKVSKHWSVELGVSYLQGNSVYEGGGYLLNAASTNLSANVVESAIADASKSSAYLTPNSPNNSLASQEVNKLYINVSKDILNNYRYMQVPLQASYTLNPEGKWNYSILGGVMTNFFLSNELESSTGSVIKTRAGDEVYRPVNLAATTGLRIQYKLSERWRANLTGSYQQGLTPGLYSNLSLESKPNLYGLGWGIRYSF